MVVIVVVNGWNYGDQCRDRFLSPFVNTSIWNMPIGSDAKFVDAYIFDQDKGNPLPGTFHGDMDIIEIVADKTPFFDWYNQGHWYAISHISSSIHI